MDAPANLSRPTCALLVDDNVDKLINMSSAIESLGIPVVMMQPASARVLLERNKCSKCNAQFSREKDYAMHQCRKRYRVEEPSATCPKCGGEFMNRRSLSIHRSRSESGCYKKEFECLECIENFPTQIALTSHSKQHKKQRDEHQETSLKAELERALREAIVVPSIIALGSTSSKMFEEMGYTPTASVVDLDSAAIM